MNRQKPPALGTLIAGIRVALTRPRVWLPLLVLSLLFGLAVAAPVHQSALQSVSHSAGFANDAMHSGANSMPRWILEDWSRLDGGPFAAASAALAPLLLLSSLLGVLIAAGWMHAAIFGKREHGLKQFLAGAGQHFFPMLRLWVLGLACYFAVTWFVWGAPGEWVMATFFPDGDVDRAASERTALYAQNARVLIYAVGLLKVEIILDLARAAIVSLNGNSALGGLLRGIRFWLWRWPSTLLLVLSGLALEVFWVALILKSSSLAQLPLWTLALSIPVGRILMRGGRASGLALLYHAATLPSAAPGEGGLSRAAKAPETLDEGSAWGSSA